MTAAAKPPRAVHAKQTVFAIGCVLALWLAVAVTAVMVAPK